MNAKSILHQMSKRKRSDSTEASSPSKKAMLDGDTELPISFESISQAAHRIRSVRFVQQLNRRPVHCSGTQQQLKIAAVTSLTAFVTLDSSMDAFKTEIVAKCDLFNTHVPALFSFVFLLHGLQSNRESNVSVQQTSNTDFCFPVSFVSSITAVYS